MSTDQPMQEPQDLTSPEDGAPSTEQGAETSAQAKPRRTRKPKAVDAADAPALSVEAVADEAPAPARKVARKRAAKVVDEQASLDLGAAAEAPVAEAPPLEEVLAKPKRAPRKRVADEVVLEQVAQAVAPAAVDAAVVEVTGSGVLSLAPEGAQAQAVVSAEGASAERQERGERGRRGERGERGPRGDRPARGPRPDGAQASSERQPQRLAGAEGAGGAEFVEGADVAEDDEQRPSRRAVIAAEQAEAVFKELLAGEFDEIYEEEVEEEGAEAASTKRVLRPEPDAPKLQKVLAQSGVGSRRDIEQMIEDGRISVNGEVAHIGQRVSFGDKIAVSGKQIRVRIQPPPARILAYHKPTGEVVTHEDPQNRPTVFRRLPRLQHGKWQSVGRLDLNTEGLLLFTNSGDLANQLMHPRFGVEREYAVRVLGSLTPDTRAQLLAGVEIEGQQASFKSIDEGGGEGANRWYRVVITEGRNREVRRLFDAVGLTVSRLIRVRYGSIVLPHGLKRGVWVELGESDVRAVKSLAGADRFEEGRGERGGRDGRGDRDGRQQGGQNNGQRGGQRQAQGVKGQQPQQGKDRFSQNGQGPRGQGPRGQGGPGGQGGNGQGPRAQGDRQERPNDRPNDRQNFRPQRDERPADNRPDGDDDFDHIGPIPNPLEQTFDKRFAKGSKRITSGFGRPDQQDTAPRGGGKKGGPREPDPLQTSVGYIGADAYFGKVGGGGGGGRGGNRSGGGGYGGGGGGGGGRGRR
jgi:23S rRNA pseudouridine2605 synthase